MYKKLSPDHPAEQRNGRVGKKKRSYGESANLVGNWVMAWTVATL